MTIPPATLEPGVSLGGFRIVRKIGSGAMGEVYLANQLSLNREVAVKVLSQELCADTEYIERFRNEVHTLAKLDHPNIVTALEAGSDFGHNFLAMSYVDGETLEARLGREGALPEKEVLAIALKVSEALAYAWERFSILHRDVKPANIMLDSFGEVRLMDMGISKQLSAESADATMAGFVIGTPHYMSPEQARGGHDVDSRSDQYSLGATMFHLLTGETPFDSENPMATLSRVLTEECPEVRELEPSVSSACSRLVARMMAKELEDRYPSWEQVIAAIRKVQSRGLSSASGRRRRSSAKSVAGHIPHAAVRAGVPGRRRSGISMGFLVFVLLSALAGFVYLTVVHPQLHPPSDGNGPAMVTPKPPRPARPRPRPKPVHPRPVVKPRPPQPEPEPEPRQVPEPEPSPGGAAVVPPVPEPGGGEAPPEELTAGQLQERNIAAALLAYRTHRQNRPEDFEGAALRLRALSDEAAGTPYEPQVQAETETLATARKQAAQTVFDALQQEVDKLVEAGQLEEALTRYERYDGAFVPETAPMRQAAIAALREQLAQRDREARHREAAQGHLEEALEEVALQVVHQDFAAAQKQAGTLMEDRRLAVFQPELKAFVEAVRRVSEMPERIRGSFRREIGQTVTLSLRNGPETVEIKEIVGTRIRAIKDITSGAVKGRMGVNIELGGLSVKEKLKRLGEERTPELLIMRGLLVLEANRADLAEKFFQESDCLLGRSLITALDFVSQEHAERSAQRRLYSILQKARLSGIEGAKERLRQVRLRMWPATLIRVLRQEVKAFNERFGRTRVAQDAAPLLTALSQLQPETWPPVQDDLVFRWANSERHPGWVTARGQAKFSVYGTMATRGGAFLAGSFNQYLLDACRASGEISVGAFLLAFARGQSGPARIISFSSGADTRDFTLGQSNDQLTFRLRTPATGDNGSNPETSFPLPALAENAVFYRYVHVMVCYRPGKLRCYVDGVQVLETETVTGDFSNWIPQHLIFGDEWQTDRDWAGHLLGITIYSRALAPAEVRELAGTMDMLLLKPLPPLAVGGAGQNGEGNNGGENGGGQGPAQDAGDGEVRAPEGG